MKSKASKIEIFILANDVSDRIRNHQMTTRWQHLPGGNKLFYLQIENSGKEHMDNWPSAGSSAAI